MGSLRKPHFIFDFDGTITSEELLPLIAKKAGIFQEMEALTEATIKGIIPFESSFKLRCKLLRDVQNHDIFRIVESVPRYRALTDFISDHINQCSIVTGNLNCWIQPIISQYNNVYSSEATEIDGHLDEVTYIMKKNQAVRTIRKIHNDSTCFVAIGDGMGDVAMFQESDLSIAFGGTHAPVDSLIKMSNYVVNDQFVLVDLLTSML